jgi:hypothetical protein
MPEIQELQAQLAAVQEQLSDLGFQAAAERESADEAARTASMAHAEVTAKLQV